MLQIRVSVVKVDLPHRRLRDKVQNVRACTTQAYDRDLVQFSQLRCNEVDFSPTGSGVDIVERGIALVVFGRDDRERLRPGIRVDGLRWAR